MKQTIQIKRSTIAGRMPSNLLAGELAVNLTDKALYTADTNNTVFQLNDGIKTVKVNGIALTPDSNKAVDISIPQSLLLMGTTPAGHTLADSADSYYSDQLGNGEAGAWFITYSDGGTIITPSTEVDASGRVKLSDGWMSRLNYSGATWANVGDILLVYKLNILFTAYKILTLNEAGETRVGLMSPVDKQRVNQVPYKLPYSTDAVYAGGVSDGAYNNVTSGRTNWIDSTALGSVISLGNLQIAVDPSGRLYSRNKNATGGNWWIINQMPTIGARDLDTVYDPCVIGYGVCPNGPTSNPSTVYTFASADVDGNGYRSLLLILIDRSTSEPYIRTSFYNPGNSNFSSTNWFKVPNAEDVEDALEFAGRDYSILLESKELSATPNYSDGTITIDGVTYYYVFLNDCGYLDLIRAINISGNSPSSIPRIASSGASSFISMDPTFLYKNIVEYDLGQDQYSENFGDTLRICIPESSSDDWTIERRTFVRESLEQQQFRETVDNFMTEFPELIERDERTVATALTDLNSRINELSEESVFIAEYGVTTYSEVKSAIDNGKVVIVKYNGRNYTLCRTDVYSSTTTYLFGCIQQTNSWYIQLSETGGWSGDYNALENSNNKKNTITGNESSTTYYPTTKAVADYVTENKDVFWATYGTTTRAEVVTAVTAGKIAACKYGDYVYYCSVINTASTSTNIYFESVEGNQVRAVYVNGGNQWGGPMGPTLEQTGNKKTTITGNESSTTYYPTTKAVADYAAPKSTAVTDISYNSTSKKVQKTINGTTSDVVTLSSVATSGSYSDLSNIPLNLVYSEIDSSVSPSSPTYYDVCKTGIVSQTQTWTQDADSGYSYTMSNPVTGIIPQANIDLFESAGAHFNTTTGYFELNGLTDISYNEMMSIFYRSSNINMQTLYANYTNLRTVLKNNGQFIAPFNSMFDNCANLEVLVKDIYPYYPNTGTYRMFYNCSKLRTIGNIVYNSTNLNGIFYGCSSLESVTIHQLKASLSISDSPRLSATSVKTMINNATNTSAITITLHATAYARATADSGVQAALSNHTTITLASA